MPGAGAYVKAIAGGVALCIGGPALVMYVMPTEEELFKKYNPDLQKRALATREQRLQEWDEFITKTKEQSRHRKPIWILQMNEEKRAEEERAQAKRDAKDAAQAEIERRKAEVRASTK